MSKQRFLSGVTLVGRVCSSNAAVSHFWGEIRTFLIHLVHLSHSSPHPPSCQRSLLKVTGREQRSDWTLWVWPSVNSWTNVAAFEHVWPCWSYCCCCSFCGRQWTSQSLHSHDTGENWVIASVWPWLDHWSVFKDDGPTNFRVWELWRCAMISPSCICLSGSLNRLYTSVICCFSCTVFTWPK